MSISSIGAGQNGGAPYERKHAYNAEGALSLHKQINDQNPNKVQSNESLDTVSKINNIVGKKVANIRIDQSANNQFMLRGMGIATVIDAYK